MLSTRDLPSEIFEQHAQRKGWGDARKLEVVTDFYGSLEAADYDDESGADPVTWILGAWDTVWADDDGLADIEKYLEQCS